MYLLLFLKFYNIYKYEYEKEKMMKRYKEIESEKKLC